ncbi:Ribokinase-like protein [Hesseltinella vesiculosa]|uniref:Ribokinase-like protein n=1 Tax=Hesseltinella vesiculosa TaxID=101127 RepID=A0A1X2G6B3_9FUNG|nr:Ribokinase-like protein [Hesseltinella vesiculosa]
MSFRPLIVVGGIALDITATTQSVKNFLHTSTVGHVRQSLGGVGRNICESAFRAGAPCQLLTVIGDDPPGQILKQGLQDVGMTTDLLCTLPGQASAVYNAFHTNDGQLLAAVADMAIFDQMDLSQVKSVFQDLEPSLVCFDGNIAPKAMVDLTKTSRSMGIPVFFEPTSIPKSVKIFDGLVDTRAIWYTSPNQYELEAMASHCTKPSIARTKLPDIDPSRLPLLAQQMLEPAWLLSHTIPHVITKLGDQGCLYVSHVTNAIAHLPAETVDPSTIQSVTGAGDSFVGVVLANLRQDPWIQDVNTWVKVLASGQKAAVRTLQSQRSVGPSIAPDLLVSV